jgi:EAL domain-containing protein (putative c-di-GMP-specific phosphodiesterase class I)
MEVELSRMLRWEGIRLGLQIPSQYMLFVNTHPLEIRIGGLVESLQMLRSLAPNMSIVLEVHEAAITEPQDMRRLKASLEDLQIQLAYDDFGAGQARLSELVEAPPDFLKFDISLIRDIDRASPGRRKMLESLLQMVLDLGINPLAEGIERTEEAEVCKELGFLTAQGYAFGHPATLESLVSKSR